MALTYGIVEHDSLNDSSGGTVYNDVVLSVHIERDWTFYMYKGALPMFISVAFGMLQYGLEQYQFADRLNVRPVPPLRSLLRSARSDRVRASAQLLITVLLIVLI